jgi:hypothetical protein
MSDLDDRHAFDLTLDALALARCQLHGDRAGRDFIIENTDQRLLLICLSSLFVSEMQGDAEDDGVCETHIDASVDD